MFEIEDRDVLEYYHTRVAEVERNIEKITKLGKAYADIKDYEETKEIKSLIRKYHGLTAAALTTSLAYQERTAWKSRCLIMRPYCTEHLQNLATLT